MIETDTNRNPIISSVPTQAELMGSPINPEAADLPTTTIDIPSGGIGIKGKLVPFRQQVLRDTTGESFTTNVYAAIADGTKKSVLFFGDDSKRWLGVVDELGGLVSAKSFPSGEGSVSIALSGAEGKPAVMLSRTNAHSNGYAWVFRFTPQEHADKQNPVLTIKEGTAYIENPVSDILRKRAEVRRKKIAKVVTGAAAVFATITPGGLIDKVMDPVVDTAAVVGEAGSMVRSHIYTSDESIDGMQLSQYPDIMASFNKEAAERNMVVDKATDVAKQAMLDLDTHNYDAIKQRADEYLERNPGIVMSRESLDAIKDQISYATTNDEILAALQPLQDFCGKQVTISSQHGVIAPSDIKPAAVGIVNALGKYPRPLVEKARFKTIVLDLLNTDINDERVAAGRYYVREGRILINVNSNLVNMLADIQEGIPIANDLGVSGKYEAVFGHEFAHALTGAVGGSGIHSGDEASNTLRDVVGALVDYPEVISGYSRTDSVEKEAEDTSGVLSERSAGLTHPDNSRRFLSPANRSMLAVLIGFGVANKGESSVDPGIIDYLVASNARLMGRSYVAFGH